MVFVLPETKGVSLERMDALFGEIDYVEAHEAERSAACNSTKPRFGPKEGKKTMTEHVDVVREEKF